MKRFILRGLRTLDLAIQHILGTQHGLGNTGFLDTKGAFRRADLYFAFGGQPRARTLDELRFIRTTFTRVQTVLISRPGATGGNPFGTSIFEIAPVSSSHVAVTPRKVDDAPGKPFHSGRVYLGDGIDSMAPDLFSHILIHELFHFVDEETAARQIRDTDGEGYGEGAMKLSHDQRMHNADNYALFASHVGMGRARLIASQPDLAPHIPADMP